MGKLPLEPRRGFHLPPFVNCPALRAGGGLGHFFALGNPLAEWHVGPLVLIPTDYGLIKFASILVRSWLSVQAAILLVATTRFPDMIHAFEHLHVPQILTTIVAFLYRYLFVLTDEVMRLLRARERAVQQYPVKGLGEAWRGAPKSRAIWRVNLFLRSYERSDRIYNAMLARGYIGQLRTLNPHMMKSSDWSFAALSSILIVILQLIGRL